jgi:hypothetical protein
MTEPPPTGTASGAGQAFVGGPCASGAAAACAL